MTAFVINLVGQTERRTQMAQRLDALGIAHEFVEAVDGRRLDEAEIARRYDASLARERYRDMTRSEIGCALSHLRVYETMLDRDLPWALVFEDDAAPGPDVPEVLAALAGQAAQGALPEPAVVLLTHVDKYTRHGMHALCDGYRTARPYGYWWRAHGYFVTQAAARSLLSGLQPLFAAADHWIEFERRGLVKMRAVVPYCIGLSELAEQSSIETLRAQEVQRDPKPRTWAYRLRKALYERFLFQLFVRPFLRVAKQPKQPRR